MHLWVNRSRGCQQAAGVAHGPDSHPCPPALLVAQLHSGLRPPSVAAAAAAAAAAAHPRTGSAGLRCRVAAAACSYGDRSGSVASAAAAAVAAAAAPLAHLETAPTVAGGSRGSAGRWVCRAAGPLVRRPPLRLQPGRGADTRADEGAEGGAGEESADEEEAEGLLPGVARVQCVQDLPRFDLPLLLGSFRSSSCNAVAVSYCGQSYLLAPAASVVYGSQIRVLLPGRDKPFPARLLHLGLECELAVLGLEATEFWESVVPYQLSPYGLPALQQRVAVVSYADGQPRPRSAPGTVMRAEVVTYPSAMQRLLGLTVAVGLSKDQIGSPVVDARGDCLGLVFARTAGSAGKKGTRDSPRWAFSGSGPSRRRCGATAD